MGEEERALLLEAFDSNWISTVGPHVDAFERELAGYVGMPVAAGLASGTAALHLAFVLLGIAAGDEVYCSDLTFAASVNAVTYVGATPVLIDSDRETWNMDPGLLEEALADAAQRGKLPKAVVVVDLYGQSASYDRIVPICERYSVPVIEDAAEALGATYQGKPVGSFGVLSAFSFNGNKIITTSGGGMLAARDKVYADLAKKLATQAREPVPHYEHTRIGYNYRLSNLLAAIGRAQLRRLDERVAQRRANFDRYVAALAKEPGISWMPEIEGGRSTRWLSCCIVDPEAFGASNEDIRVHLESRQIEARAVWKPMHLQPVFAGVRCIGGAVSRGLFERGLCLPSGSNLSREEQDRVIDAVLSTPRRPRSLAK